MRSVFAVIVTLFLSTLSPAQTFTLKSNDLTGQFTKEFTLNGFGCTGANKSPHLTWNNPPSSAKSFAITMYDPAAPTGSGWWHWVMFDIPAAVTELMQGAGNTEADLAPTTAIQSITDFGNWGYGGPCPPEGGAPHPYIITVFALKTAKLGLDKNASPAMVGFMINQQVIEKASLIVFYKR
jgi:Raf kinase inhibitor-like YbhB/YbcL family protein